MSEKKPNALMGFLLAIQGYFRDGSYKSDGILVALAGLVLTYGQQWLMSVNMEEVASFRIVMVLALASLFPILGRIILRVMDMLIGANFKEDWKLISPEIRMQYYMVRLLAVFIGMALIISG